MEFGFPALVYIRTGNNKQFGFVHHGKFDSAALSAFVSAGKSMQKAIGEHWPSIATTDAWDGEDAVPLEEDDDDFDLDAFLNDDD